MTPATSPWPPPTLHLPPPALYLLSPILHLPPTTLYLPPATPPPISSLFLHSLPAPIYQGVSEPAPSPCSIPTKVYQKSFRCFSISVKVILKIWGWELYVKKKKRHSQKGGKGWRCVFLTESQNWYLGFKPRRFSNNCQACLLNWD